MNISLPPTLREWVDDQVEKRGFGTASEFVRDMLRCERARSARYRMDQLLMKAVSTPVSEMTDQDWVDIEKEGLERARKRKKA